MLFVAVIPVLFQGSIKNWLTLGYYPLPHLELGIMLPKKFSHVLFSLQFKI